MALHLGKKIKGFPEITGTFLGGPTIRTMVFWGLYWGPLILGNYHNVFASWRLGHESLER